MNTEHTLTVTYVSLSGRARFDGPNGSTKLPMQAEDAAAIAKVIGAEFFAVSRGGTVTARS